MAERVLQFGPKRSLTGILNEASGEVGVVFLNSGILHSVGASRLHVKLSRGLSILGYSTFRFDQSTIGDSGQRFAGGDYLSAAVSETKLAIDLVCEKSSAKKIVIFGLCSGADVGFYTALEDPRVVGLIQLDPYVYRTPGFYFNYYIPRIKKFNTWLNFCTRKFYGKKHIRECSLPTENNKWFSKPEYIRQFPKKEQVASGYSELIERGVRFLCVFSGGMANTYNYEGQFENCFSNLRFKGSLQESFFPASTHIFTDFADQLALEALTKNWFIENYALKQNLEYFAEEKQAI